MTDQAPESALDLKLALARVGGDTELLREIAVLFIEDCPRSLREIHEAVQDQDSAKLERAAHALKGSVSNFGAQFAVDAAFQLEQMGRKRELLKSKEMLRVLESALTAVCSKLETL